MEFSSRWGGFLWGTSESERQKWNQCIPFLHSSASSPGVYEWRCFPDSEWLHATVSCCNTLVRGDSFLYPHSYPHIPLIISSSQNVFSATFVIAHCILLFLPLLILFSLEWFLCDLSSLSWSLTTGFWIYLEGFPAFPSDPQVSFVCLSKMCSVT